MSDRFEIQDLMVGYCYAVDNLDLDALDNVFSEDVVVDYSEMVGFKGGLKETKQFLKEGLGVIPAYQHAVSTTQYKFSGDTCETRTVCFNPMVVKNEKGEDQTFFFGLWYLHTFKRTPKGWRMTHLYEKKCYNHNVPDFIKAITAQ
jgi:hypothetical protein